MLKKVKKKKNHNKTVNRNAHYNTLVSYIFMDAHGFIWVSVYVVSFLIICKSLRYSKMSIKIWKKHNCYNESWKYLKFIVKVKDEKCIKNKKEEIVYKKIKR